MKTCSLYFIDISTLHYYYYYFHFSKIKYIFGKYRFQRDPLILWSFKLNNLAKRSVWMGLIMWWGVLPLVNPIHLANHELATMNPIQVGPTFVDGLDACSGACVQEKTLLNSCYVKKWLPFKIKLELRMYF